MKITELKTFHVRPRWLFLKISTDEGIVGYGEPVVEGRARTVEKAVEEFAEYLVGKDPMQIQHHWQVLYKNSYYRGGPVLLSALSGIEQALWDIKGKFYGMPVYEMLGGKCRDKIRMYTHIKPTAIKAGNSIEEMVALAKKRVEEGYTALKYSIIPPVRFIENKAALAAHIERFARVREAAGDGIDLAIDFHGRVSRAMAPRTAKELEPYYPMFIEEPCSPEDLDGLTAIARQTSIPIATGERIFTKWGFRDLLEKKAVSIVQPDLCHGGGIFETLKIAAMAEAYNVTVAPHNPLGPISLAACLQMDAACPSFLIQEHPLTEDKSDLGNGILKDPFEIKNGYIDVPSKPGLGIEVDEEEVKRRAYPGDWTTPLLYFEDGSLADW
jgi:galactonate dehydratase